MHRVCLGAGSALTRLRLFPARAVCRVLGNPGAGRMLGIGGGSLGRRPPACAVIGCISSPLSPSGHLATQAFAGSLLSTCH